MIFILIVAGAVGGGIGGVFLILFLVILIRSRVPFISLHSV